MNEMASRLDTPAPRNPSTRPAARRVCRPIGRWYGEIIANDLKRLARKNGLVPVGLSLVPAYKGKRHRGLRVVIQSQVWPEREAEAQPVATPSETDEKTFRARFGFDAPPTVRAQVYQLKAANELASMCRR